MIRVNIRTTSTSIVSLVELEQVNVCCDVIKSLLNDCWSTLKLLCIKCFPRSSNVYWHNALMYNPFLNKYAGDTFRSSLSYNASARHEPHEWDTNDTSVIRVRHERDMSNISVTQVQHECYTDNTSTSKVLHE